MIAADGLWDVVPNEDAVSLAQSEEEPEAAARKLTFTASTRGSADSNSITCIVVKFRQPELKSNLNAETGTESSPKAETELIRDATPD